MSDHQKIFIDSFLTQRDNTQTIPDDAEFLCSYDLDFMLDFGEESAYVRHTEACSELWIETEFGMALAVSVPKTSSADVPVPILMKYRFDSVNGFAVPATFHKAGLMNEAEYTAIIDNIKAEREAAWEAAQKARAEIIDLAEDLGLHPRPTGAGADQWAADCPGTSHCLFIVSSTSSFGCGYCNRKGGPDELRAFVEDRRKRDEERRNQP